MTDVRLSVIIPVWNGQKLLPDCLDALLAQADAVHEIIAVDNGSTDGSAELIADRYGQVRLFRNPQNFGFAHACNVGMRAATGDVCVLLNQDTRVEPGWGAAVRAAFADGDARIIGCKILSAVDRSLQHAGGSIHELLGTPFHLGKDSGDDGAWGAMREVEYVTGAAMAIHRRVIERVGLLDERFFPAYYEDVDFCFRARAAGFKVLYWPQAVVLHHESTSTPERTRWFYFQRGRIRLLLKHWPLERLIGPFADAEAAFQMAFAHEFGNTRPLRLAYTAGRIEAPAIVGARWPDGDALAQITQVLRRLHEQALAIELAKSEGQGIGWPQPLDSNFSADPGVDTRVDEQRLVLPHLEEFTFRSKMPVVGGLITAFRRAWYAVAAKWALRHLMAQQQAINQSIVRQFEYLDRQMAAMIVRQEAANRRLLEQLNEQARRAAVTDRFLLEAIVQAEEEAVFALLWPLRWDLVLDPASVGGKSDG